MLVQGAMLEEAHCAGQISVIELHNSDITSEGVKHLAKLPEQLINKLEGLYLGHNTLATGSCAAIAHLIPNLINLKRLSLSYLHKVDEGEAV